MSGLVEVWLSAGCSVALQNYETVSLEDFHISGRWFFLWVTLTSGIVQKLINRCISLNGDIKIHCLIPNMGKVGQSGEGDVKKASLPPRSIVCTVCFCYNNMKGITVILILSDFLSKSSMLRCAFANLPRPWK